MDDSMNPKQGGLSPTSKQAGFGMQNQFCKTPYDLLSSFCS